MAQTVLQKIKGQFASLQVEVRSAMEARQVKVKDVHQFLVSFFQTESRIPEAPDLTKLFNIITEAMLWSYDHYSPLKELTEKFLPDNNPARKLVSEYKNQLSGFYTTTKIIDFIDLSELDDPEDDSDSDSEDGAKQSLSPKEYKKLYHELKVTLKLDRKIKLSDLTMSYVETLWKALIEEFNLEWIASDRVNSAHDDGGQSNEQGMLWVLVVALVKNIGVVVLVVMGVEIITVVVEIIGNIVVDMIVKLNAAVGAVWLTRLGRNRASRCT